MFRSTNLAESLTGRFRRGHAIPSDSPWANNVERFKSFMTTETDLLIHRMQEIASLKEISTAQLAIAWLIDKDGITAPIIGPDKPEHIDELLTAVDVRLTKEERTELDSLSDWDRYSKIS